MDQEKHRQYTAEDIVRYHQGLLTPQEMHQMERAALEDPFLADALEGYVHARQPLEDLAALRQELDRRTGKKGVVVPFRMPAFLKIAALIMLLAGFAWIAYYLNSGGQDLAVHREAQMHSEPETVPPAAAADSANSSFAAPAADDRAGRSHPLPRAEERNVNRSEPTQTTAAPPAGVAADADITSVTANTKEVAAKSVKSATVPAAESSAPAQNRSVATANVISGKVVDNNNIAVPNAQLFVPQQQTSYRADANGLFSIPVQDSSINVTVQSLGYEEKQAHLRNNAANRIVLQPSESSLDEVVVTGYGTRRQAAPGVVLEGAVPVSDPRNYERFVLEQLKPSGTKQAAVRGFVELAFDIDGAGKPIRIEVEKSQCSGCDSIAIKAIQDAPPLKKTRKNRKARARILF